MDILKELIDLGAGVVALTQEKAEKIVKELVKKGKIGEKESKAFIRRLVKKGAQESKNLKAEVAKIAREVVNHLNLATKDEVRRLEREIAELKKQRHHKAK